MTDISITLANGVQIPFDISEDGSGPPCFLLSVRKCGSSVTNNICKALARANGRCFVEVGDIFFRSGLRAEDWNNDPAVRQILRPGVIYGGFRDAPMSLFEDPAFMTAPKLFLIRDPRDALVSEYFSTAYSHPVPPATDHSDLLKQRFLTQRATAQSEAIETFLQRKAKWMERTIMEYGPVVAMPNVLVVKYENIILRKTVLIEQVARHFGMDTTPEMVADILSWADNLPMTEDPHAFVRQVLPGDHTRKLAASTIARLNGVLAGSMRLFGYAA